MLRFIPDCYKAVDNYFHAFEFIPDCHNSFTNKMLEKLDNIVFLIDNIDLDDIDSDIVKFFGDGMGPNTILMKMILLILFLY